MRVKVFFLLAGAVLLWGCEGPTIKKALSMEQDGHSEENMPSYPSMVHVVTTMPFFQIVVS